MRRATPLQPTPAPAAPPARTPLGCYPRDPRPTIALLTCLWLVGLSLTQWTQIWPDLLPFAHNYLYIVGVPAAVWGLLGLGLHLAAGRLREAGLLVGAVLGFWLLQALAPPTFAALNADLPPASPPEALFTTTPPPLTPRATATPLPDHMVGTVTGDGLNVRTGPGTQYSRITHLNSGDLVDVIGRDDLGEWLVVSYPGYRGWVAREFMTLPAEPWGLPVVEVDQ